MLNELSNCNRNSAILPVLKANQLAGSLRLKGKGPISNGVLITDAIIYGIKLADAPYHVLRRMAGLKASGLIDWWINYLLRYVSDDKSVKNVNPTSMKGNIVMVFLILVMGVLGVGTTALIIKNVSRILKFLIRHLSTFILSITTWVLNVRKSYMLKVCSRKK